MRPRTVVICLAALAVMNVAARAAADNAQTAGTTGTPERVYDSRQLQHDFQQMYRGLQEASFDLYAFTPKAELNRLYVEALASFDRPLTLLQAKTRFERFAATVRMGDTRVDSPVPEWTKFLQAGGRSFPLGVRIISGRVYVTQNLSGVEAIGPGDELLSLNGEPMSRLITRIARQVSAETDYMAQSLIEQDFSRYLWLERGAVEEFVLGVRHSAGHTDQVRVPARTETERQRQRARVPPVLDLESPPRTSRMLAGGVAYLRPGPFHNMQARTASDQWDVSGFRQFIDRAFAAFAAAHADRVIIDLRDNPGGDEQFSDVMLSWFASRPFRFASQIKVRVSPESIAANNALMAHGAAEAGPMAREYASLYSHAHVGDVVDLDIPMTPPRSEGRFTGKVFVLVDRQTYANAVAVAALIQDYKFGLILGEPTSDMASRYGVMEQFTLRNTGLIVGYPTARIIRPNGDPRPRGVTPDVLISIPIVQAPDDPVLAQAIAIARSR